jgi:hypothetical protein
MSTGVTVPYEREFALAATSEVLATVTLGMCLTAMTPGVSWAYVKTTTGPITNPVTNSSRFPIVTESFSLWSWSCTTDGMKYTYDSSVCDTRYQVIQGTSTTAVIFASLSVIFGLMPFSPVAPREPKRSLTHAMLCQMTTGLFSLISFTVFFGGLVNGVWAHPNSQLYDPTINKGAVWNPYQPVVVTSGGIVAVTTWTISFFAWMLSLAAMIKYDASAAEKAIIMHNNKKEERERRRADLIARLGNGAILAAQQGIGLDLGDKLYVGGTIVAGATSTLAWMNMGLAPLLMLDFHAISQTSAAFMILNVIATATGTAVLLAGLVDLVPRPKASIGGFAVFAVVTSLWVAEYGMTLDIFRKGPILNTDVLSFEAAVGTLGCGFSLSSVAILYHPFKIWELAFVELPRPAKMFAGLDGLSLVLTAACFALIASNLSGAAVTLYLYDAQTYTGDFSVYLNITSPSLAPSRIPGSPAQTCPNSKGDRCNVGPEYLQCCKPPYECVETSYTTFTCQIENKNWIPPPKTAFPVAQAFLALTVASTMLSFVFYVAALAPNGLMDTSRALSVAFGTSLASFLFGCIAFSTLQSFYLSNSGVGMPIECGYLLGCWILSLLSGCLGFGAWWPYHIIHIESQPGFDISTKELKKAQRLHEIERLKFEAIKYRMDRLELQNKINNNQSGGGGDDGGGGGNNNGSVNTARNEEEDDDPENNDGTSMIKLAGNGGSTSVGSGLVGLMGQIASDTSSSVSVTGTNHNNHHNVNNGNNNGIVAIANV